MTFGDLILEVAREMGVAYYGADGTEEAQIPTNAHDLTECERHVNNGLRMFFNDAPASGWRFLRPTLKTDVWADVDTDSSVTATSVTDNGVTLMTVTGGTPFHESMEFKMVTVTDLTNQVMIKKVTSTTTAEIDLNGESDFSAKTFAITADGQYTLPPYFAGTQMGVPTYEADSNIGGGIEWGSEAEIRRMREDSNDTTGDPLLLAVRVMLEDGLGNALKARRFELMTWPTPSGDEIVEFPFEFHFDKMTNHLENPPVPFTHDETLKEACLAVVERDVYDNPGRHSEEYHQKALPKSYERDARLAPKRLGYFGNRGMGKARDINRWRENIYDRPDVTGDGFN
jgi:hypothetical protein